MCRRTLIDSNDIDNVEEEVRVTMFIIVQTMESQPLELVYASRTMKLAYLVLF